MTESLAHAIRARATRNTSRAQRLAFYATSFAGLAPWASAWLPFGAGGALGTYAAWRGLRTHKQTEDLTLDSRYAFQPLADGEVVKHLYIGHAIRFEEWRDEVNALRQQYGHVDAAAKKQLLLKLMSDGRLKPLYWSDEMQVRHWFIGGSTGLGKTSFSQSISMQQIFRGGGLLAFDAKGSESRAASLMAVARAAGREHDVQYFNLEEPKLSHTYNPLLYGNARQTISTIMKLYKKGGDQFFYTKTRNALAAATVCFLNQPGKPPFNFKDVAAVLGSLPMFTEMWRRIPRENRAAREFVALFLNEWFGLNQDGEVIANDKRFYEINSGVKGVVTDFCHSEYGELLNDYNPDIELKESILTNKIVLISVQALSDQQTTEIFGKLLKADLARAMGQMNDERVRPLIPFLCDWDEYGMFADGDSGSDETIFAQAREANVALMPSVQGRSFLDKLNPYFTDNVLTNCWNHLWFDVRDQASRKTASDLAGMTLSRFQSESHSASYGKGFDNSETGSLRGESFGSGENTSSSEKREQLLMPEDFEMDKGEAILVGKFGTYKLLLPLVKLPEPLPPLSSYNIPRYEKPQRQGLDLMARGLAEFDKMINRASR